MPVGKEALPIGVSCLRLLAAPAARPVVGQPLLRRILRHAVFLRNSLKCALICILRANLIGAVRAVAQILGRPPRIPIGEENPAAARAVRDCPQMEITPHRSGVDADVRLTATRENPAPAIDAAVLRDDGITGTGECPRGGDIAAARLHRIGEEIALLCVVVDGGTVRPCAAPVCGSLIPVGLLAGDAQPLLCAAQVGSGNRIACRCIQLYLVGWVAALDEPVDVDVACRNRDILARDPCGVMSARFLKQLFGVLSQSGNKERA